ncbi:MAG: hypothetical protein ACRDV3_05560 [Acidothermaceae bacterium]
MDISNAISVVSVAVVVIVLLPLIVGGVFVIVVVANRADPDPSGRRPAVVYAFGTAFVTLFASLFATTGLVASLCQLIGPHVSADPGFDLRPSSALHPIGDAAARGSVIAGLIALAAGVAFVAHLRAAFRGSDGAPAGHPVARVKASYVSAVAFVTVLTTIGASVVAVYSIFRIVAPGVFAPDGPGDRAAMLRTFLPAVFLAVASLVILLAHLRHAPPPFRPSLFNFGGPAPAASPSRIPETPRGESARSDGDTPPA